MAISKLKAPSMMIQCTPAALSHIRNQYPSDVNSMILRIQLEKKGCSGWVYRFDFAEKVEADEVTCQVNDELAVSIPREHVNWFDGAVLDYVKSGFNGKLTCLNPNGGTYCGCGESFMIPKHRE